MMDLAQSNFDKNLKIIKQILFVIDRTFKIEDLSNEINLKHKLKKIKQKYK